MTFRRRAAMPGGSAFTDTPPPLGWVRGVEVTASHPLVSVGPCGGEVRPRV